MEPWQHQVENIITDAEVCFDGNDLDTALEYFRDAFRLIPDPKREHGETTRVIAAIGDCLLSRGDYSKAKDAFDDVLLCPGGAANPFIRLRRGQVAYKLGLENDAIVELTCAYLNGGAEVFEGEDSIFRKLAERNLGIDS